MQPVLSLFGVGIAIGISFDGCFDPDSDSDTDPETIIAATCVGPGSLPPADENRRMFFGRNGNSLNRAVEHAEFTQHTFIRICYDGLFLFFIQSDDIHGTAFDTYPAAGA